MKALLDTNVLLRAAQPSLPLAADVRDSLSALVAAGVRLCLVPQNLYEFWVVATRPVNLNGFGLDTKSATRLAEECLQNFTLLKDERGIFATWFDLVDRHAVVGKLAHDARLVAAMQRHSLVNLVTFNKSDFSRFPLISTFSPRDILSGILPVT